MRDLHTKPLVVEVITGTRHFLAQGCDISQPVFKVGKIPHALEVLPDMIGTLVCDYQVWARIPYYKLNIISGCIALYLCSFFSHLQIKNNIPALESYCEKQVS